ncbi:hypothetical protein [Rheinheimera sp.]|jgi:hypothetical protein|uniref:hypothetical protein n=1 Tax=Rheinheimera sp. TaxID=1869214 RepID=UPI003D283355
MKKLCIAAVVFTLTGCASIMTAEEQSIKVTASNNQPIEVTVDDKKTTTPGTVVVLRDGKDKVVTSSTPGCHTATPIKKNVAPVFWGNIIIGGVLGSTTDSSTGKMWNYADSVEVTCAAQ